MTAREYFEKKQPINGETDANGNYINYSTIRFDNKEKEGCYMEIYVAHIGESTWSFGWQVKDGRKSHIERKCSSHVSHKGNVRNMIYGLTKVLWKHIDSTNSSKAIRDIGRAAMNETLKLTRDEKSK